MAAETVLPDRIGWRGSRRRLLGATAGLLLPTRVTRGPFTTPVPTPSPPAGLRDFTYVCAAFLLEAHERNDLKALADVRSQQSLLFLTPNSLAQPTEGYSQEQAQRIFADGARQLYAKVAMNNDQSRIWLANIVEGTTPEGADDILQLFRANVRPRMTDLTTPSLAPDADAAYLYSGWGYQPDKQAGPEPYHWLICGLRFGCIALGWQAGFRTETPDLALAGSINRVLRDYLTDQGASSRRGASLAFLLTVPEQLTSIAVGPTILDGTILGYWDWDEAEIARRQAQIPIAGIVNEGGGSFRGPGRLAVNTIIDEFASAGQAKQWLASLRRDQSANDQKLGVARRPLASDEFSLTAWDDWQAYAARVQRGQYGFLGIGGDALLDTFLVHIEVGDDVGAGAGTTPAGRGDPALAAWSAIAQRLVAPAPATVRHAGDPAARAVFAPPLPAFADPLTDQAAP